MTHIGFVLLHVPEFNGIERKKEVCNMMDSLRYLLAMVRFRSCHHLTLNYDSMYSRYPLTVVSMFGYVI